MQFSKNFLFKILPVMQLVNFPTWENSILDIIITNSPDLYDPIEFDPPLGKPDHVVLKASLKICTESNLLKQRQLKNFKNTGCI